jgi:hypothetical protein
VKRIVKSTIVGGLAVFFLSVRVAHGQSSEDLAKKTQNPVSDLISVPFQSNINFGLGPYIRTQHILNIQPVIPFRIGGGWNLITRVIAPVVSQPNITSPEGRSNGFGDLNPTFFLSPAEPGRVIWGIGPTLGFPTASDTSLGTGKWTAGPSVVLLAIPGKWVVGTLVSNAWSFAGNRDRPAVNQFALQYFVNYNYPKGWYFTSSPILSANWRAASGERWTVPFGAGMGRIFRAGKMPLNAQAQAFYFAEKPEHGPDWGLRFQLQFLFPK